jgi:hypothetical protein
MKTLLFTILITMLFTLTISAQESGWWKENKVYSFNNTPKWDKWDKILMISYTASTVVDTLQTREIFNDSRYYEKNNVINYMVKKTGRGSIPVYFLALNLGYYKIADHLNPIPRKFFLIGINAFSYDAVNNNYKLGVKFNF